ncbi:MAG: hypothetical protein ACPG4J_08855 [Lentibacter algarum]
MIEPNAKCVVNGSKLNEAIDALNALLNIDITMADVSEPQVKYGAGGVQIVIPAPDAFANELLDVVDYNNSASTRWFITSSLSGKASSSGTQSGAPINKSQSAGVGKNRDSLDRQGGNQNQRNKLNRATGGGQGLNIARPVAPPKTANGGGAFGGGTDAFGNELHADGSRVTPEGRGGALRDDGTTTRTGGMPLRTGDMPLRTGDMPLRTGDMPLRTGDMPLRTGDRARPGAPPKIPKPPIAKRRSGRRKRDYKGTLDIDPGYRKSRGRPMRSFS